MVEDGLDLRFSGIHFHSHVFDMEISGCVMEQEDRPRSGYFLSWIAKPIVVPVFKASGGANGHLIRCHSFLDFLKKDLKNAKHSTDRTRTLVCCW